MTENRRRAFALTTVLLLMLATPSESTKTEDAPKRTASALYKTKCAWCHGSEGKGDGPASEFLLPPPRNFTRGVYKFVSTVPGEITLASDKDIFNAIANGLPGTAMMPWRKILTESEILSLVSFVKDFTDIYAFEGPPRDLPSGRKIPPSQESLRKGRFLFRHAGCFECHGEMGRGDGSKKLQDPSGNRVWPRNLTKPWTFKGGRKPEDIFKRISSGIPGTPMPAFGGDNRNGKPGKILTEEERWHIVNFVLSLEEKSFQNNQTNIHAKFVQNSLPAGVNDKKWKAVEWTPFNLSPNLITGEKLYTPLNDTLRVKALFNGTGLALLLTWGDRTKSMPFNKLMENLGGEEIFQDSVAVQFPLKTSHRREKPALAHGLGGRRVLIWQWKSGTKEDPPKAVELTGAGVMENLRENKTEGGLYSKGVYENGQWRVLLKKEHFQWIQEDRGDSNEIPVSFANWDGSNDESGSRHTFTRWGTINLTSPGTWTRFLYPASLFLTLLCIQFFLAKKLSTRVIQTR